MKITTEMARFCVYTEEGDLVGRFKTKEEAEEAAGIATQAVEENSFDGEEEDYEEEGF